jgi:histidine ammonia-lyase
MDERPVSVRIGHVRSPADAEYGMRLLRSHAVDAGDPLDDRTVRAMLAVG